MRAKAGSEIDNDLQKRQKVGEDDPKIVDQPNIL